MPKNIELVQKGINAMHAPLANYVTGELIALYDRSWWYEVTNALSDQTDLRVSGTDAELVASLDFANCLRLIDRKWGDVFRRKMSLDFRTWAKELMGARNRIAHAGSDDIEDDRAWRDLDTMARLCDAFDSNAAGEIRDIMRELRYGPSSSTSAAGRESSIASTSYEGGTLPSWRDLIEPHQDVAQGRYQNAEFAADLSQVARGAATYEYQDPVEFFKRTYLTEGMNDLLLQAVKRVAGIGGEPVIQLKTAFGGGKTHSLLALYHLLQKKAPIANLLGMSEMLQKEGISDFPQAHIAVLVGTALDPSKSKRPPTMPGITVNTLWGEMAFQLASAAGKPEAYNIIKDSDRNGVSPGSDALRQLFDECGPCVILMDEFVAYGRKIFGKDNLPAGTYENFITFIQEVTEAAKLSKASVVVASIPESDIEIGGDAGKEVLRTIEQHFGRLESIWKPVTVNEGFEIVRRRLFLECKDIRARDQVCAEFASMYQNNVSMFPVDSREPAYLERLKKCYPIHPEVFDILYEQWSTLDRFQRTRGVLRLMASVIHELWTANDQSPLIMPGSFPLNAGPMKNELTRYLSDEWNAIVDKEVDGRNSVPYIQDKENTRYGRNIASRRVARTVLLGSAPTTRAQSVRGVDKTHIRLGTVLPGESISVFDDALNALHTRLSYLYADSGNERFWYDTRPTLRKTMEERAALKKDDEADDEIKHRVGSLRREPPFGGIHICPSVSFDVPDEQTVRLVVLSPKHTYMHGSQSPALTFANDVLLNRGAGARTFKNMIIFVAPDNDTIAMLRKEVKQYLAWKDIKRDADQLNLDAGQNREVDNSISRTNTSINQKIDSAYRWMLIPTVAPDNITLRFDVSQLPTGSGTLLSRAARTLNAEGQIIDNWFHELLKATLDQYFWKDRDSISIREVWDALSSYCYLSRLANYEVLLDSIRKGVQSNTFGFAHEKKDGHFEGLILGAYLGSIGQDELIVKTEVAQKQIADDEANRIVPPEPGPAPDDKPDDQKGQEGGSGDQEIPPVPPQRTGPKHFKLETKVDNIRANRQFGQIIDEVVNHLDADGAQVEIHVTVVAHIPNGASQQTQRVVTENCRTLRLDDFGFEE